MIPLESSTSSTSYAVLCTIPVLLLITVASLDNADKQLLASSFPILEHTLHLNIKTLGYFSLFTNLAYALSLPFWGYCVHKYGLSKVFLLLSVACGCWGFSTMGIAVVASSIVGQLIFRTWNGWMLGAILPLSQTVLVELVPATMRGRAFGIMAVSEKLAGTLATTSLVYWEDHWQYAYWCLGVLSIVMGWLLYHQKLDTSKRQEKEEDEHHLTLRQIMERIIKMPAFRCLVAQGKTTEFFSWLVKHHLFTNNFFNSSGIFGATPWDMMSFQLLLLEWRGFTKDEIVSLQFISGIAATVGCWIGGYFGDILASKYETHGRILVGFISIVGGIPCYGFFLYSTTFSSAIIFLTLFHLIATWSPAAAIRPLCADLTRNPSERAQIVSIWIVIEKGSAAIFGAPLLGFLTNHVLLSKDDDEATLSNEAKASALAHELFILSSLFWIICAFFWVFMARSMPRKMKRSNSATQLTQLPI